MSGEDRIMFLQQKRFEAAPLLLYFYTCMDSEYNIYIGVCFFQLDGLTDVQVPLRAADEPLSCGFQRLQFQPKRVTDQKEND